MTLYEELELSTDCSFDEIKQQYRILAMKHHPDHGGSVDKFQKIKFAYEVLSDPIRRKQYDETSTTGESTNIRTEAINHLAGIFFSIIPNFNCAEGNLIETMNQTIEASRLQIVNDTMMCDIYINNLELVKNKLKLKNPNKEDIVMSFVDKQLENRHNDKKVFAHRLDLFKEIQEILNDYQYGFLELVSEQPTET
jgi:DnaJ-class molecular chaperone